jgi:hypothetical protein
MANAYLTGLRERVVLTINEGASCHESAEIHRVSVRIPRHSAKRSTNIRPVIPPTSGRPFHEHPATWEVGLRGKLSSLISGYPVMGDSNPRALFTHVAAELGARNIGFLFIREIWGEDSLLSEMKRHFGGAVICNELMSAADGERLIEAGHADAIAFGRDYIANPDLVERIRLGAELTPADTATFFTSGSNGYDDYLTLAEIREGKVRRPDPAAEVLADEFGRYSR